MLSAKSPRPPLSFWSALRLLAVGQFRVSRIGAGFKITWGETLFGNASDDGRRKRKPASPKDAGESRPDTGSNALHPMLSELTILLNAKPIHRRALKHLVFVEHALQRKGLRALDVVRQDILERALEQLCTLMSQWSSRELEGLALKMEHALCRRQGSTPASAEAGQVVTEGSLSDFFMLADEIIPETPKATATA